MTKWKLYWLCQILGWGIYGIAQVLLYASAQGFDVHQAFGEVYQVAYYIATTHLLRLAIIRLGWLNLRLTSLVPRLFAFTLILSVFNYLFLLLIESAYHKISPKDLQLMTFIINTLLYWFLYFLWTIFYFIFHYVERYNNSLKAETAAREVELINLKAQLNPHFIFNALNSIRALVDEDPRKSKESITQLSNILRNSLISDRKKLVPFSEELKIVMDYLALESIRFEERLEAQCDIDRNSERFMIPPLMIQTLVENGIKHGISTLKKGGKISITSRVERKHLLVEIRNTGQLSKNFDRKDGFGINNTKKRLDLIFGEDAGFEIKNDSEKTVLCSLSIPTYDRGDFI